MMNEIVDHTPQSMMNLVPVRSVQLPRITSSNIIHLEYEVGLDEEEEPGHAAQEGGTSRCGIHPRTRRCKQQ